MLKTNSSSKGKSQVVKQKSERKIIQDRSRVPKEDTNATKKEINEKGCETNEVY